MDILMKVVRWVLGLLLLFTSLGALFTGDLAAATIMLAGVFVMLPPSGAWLGKAIKPLTRHAASIAISLVLFFAGIAWATINDESAPPKASVEASSPPSAAKAQPTSATPARKREPPKHIDVKAKIGPYAVMPIEGEGWDKTRREWGNAAIERINAAMPKVAEKVAQSASCDYVELVGLSDRSKPKTMAVFFVDCRNGQRFYVSEEDLETTAAVVSKNAKTAAISDVQAVQTCETSVKSQLNFPLSFDRDLLNTSVYRAPTGNIAVSFTFQAKNALGAELPQRARCVIDDTGIHPAEISNG